MSLCSTPRCPCSDNPFTNLSSEHPDHPIFVGVSWQSQVPFAGANWSASQCAATCFSEVSQQAADLCAQTAAQNCIPQDCFGPCCPCTSEDPDCNPCSCPEADPTHCRPAPRFCNVLQGCQGNGRTATIVPCAVVAHSQADADAIAASICQEEIRTGGGRPDVPGCPVITSMSPPSPVNLNEGDSVTLEVHFTYTGAGPLTFLWALDGFPLAITTTGVFSIASVTLADAGSYTVAITAPSCPTIFSPSVTIAVSSPCGQTGDPVPSDFLVDDGTVIGTFTLAENPKSFPGLIEGRYRIHYISGTNLFLNRNFNLCANPCEFSQRFITTTNGTLDYNDGFGPQAWFGPTTNYGCFSPNGDCGNLCSEADLLAQLLVDSPTQDVTEMDLIGLAPGVTGTAACTIVGLSLCPGDVDDQIFSLVRTKVFMPEPDTATVKDWDSVVKLSIKPPGTLGPDVAPEWDGILNIKNLLPAMFSLSAADGSYIGNVFLSGILCQNAPGRWTFQIDGTWDDIDGNHFEHLWTGEKLYGLTPLGNYQKVSAWNEDAVTCIVLE